MAFDPGKISEFPGLREWMVADHWQDHFDRPTLQRSRPYVSERMIKDLRFEDGSSPGHVALCGRIEGTAFIPYHARVTFKPGKGQWKMEYGKILQIN